MRAEHREGAGRGEEEELGVGIEHKSETTTHVRDGQERGESKETGTNQRLQARHRHIIGAICAAAQGPSVGKRAHFYLKINKPLLTVY